MSLKQEAIKELAIRELEKRYTLQRENFWEFVKFVWAREKKKHLDENWHILEICRKLEAVERGEIKRLIINVPPRSLKTELVSIAFPAWCLGRDMQRKFMDVSYSSTLAEKNSGLCRALYKSESYGLVFPRRLAIRDDQDTKQHRENVQGGQYYATGSDGTVTGVGTDYLLIDDPLKPSDAMSDTVRQKVNNNYHDTLESRLNDKQKGAIVIIMQRLHDDDLCGHLMELEANNTGEKWEKLIIPAIAEVDEVERRQGQSFFEKRFPLTILSQFKTQDPIVFACQYQQNPVNKETQEFHEEWFRYHGSTGKETPKNLRIFTAVDPAFKTNQENDNSAIITAGFVRDECYILEYSHGKFSPDVLLDKMIYHIRKRSPEKIGIEAYQAQSMIVTFLKNEMERQRIHAQVEEISQTGDKLTKIRKLVPLYRRGLVYHTLGMEGLESELKRFPRGKHDDLIDALQMVYSMYELQPNSTFDTKIKMEWDEYGRPLAPAFYNDDFYA